MENRYICSGIRYKDIKIKFSRKLLMSGGTPANNGVHSGLEVKTVDDESENLLSTCEATAST